MKQKLIMENWRRFLNENKEPTLDELAQMSESDLDESLLAGLTMALFSVGGQEIELNNKEIAKTQQMINNMEKAGDTYAGVPVEDIQTAFDKHMAAAKAKDTDGDGKADSSVEVKELVQGQKGNSVLGQVFIYVDGLGLESPTADTADGDTGAPSQIDKIKAAGKSDLTPAQQQAAKDAMKSISNPN